MYENDNYILQKEYDFIALNKHTEYRQHVPLIFFSGNLYKSNLEVCTQRELFLHILSTIGES